MPTERSKRDLSDDEIEQFGKLSSLRFLERYGKLPENDHLPDEKHPGLRSMDVKGKANDNAGDGNNPTSHVSQAAYVDSKKRQSISQVVNPSHFTPTPEELQEDRSDESGGENLEPNDVSESDRAETDEEIASLYRERYGHHDSHDR